MKGKPKRKEKGIERNIAKERTFIPIIGTQLTAVPVAFPRNSARVSSAIVRRLRNHKIAKKSNKHTT